MRIETNIETQKAIVIHNLEMLQIAYQRNDIPPQEYFSHIEYELEDIILKMVMKLTKDNQSQAAKLLKINRNTLRKRLKQHGIL